MANPFTDYLSGTTGGVTSILDKVISLGIKVIIGILFIVFLIVIYIWYKNKKNYNIPITIWIPRSNNKIIDETSAKGGYFKIKSNEGSFTTVFRIKRKGTPIVEMPPPSSHFLIGLHRKLYLIQKGIDDFESVDPTGFRYVETSQGRKIPIIDLKCINQDATAWVEDNRESAKKRFTLHGFWEKYKDFIQITLFIFIVMIAMYVNWQGLKEVASELARVAENLGGGVNIKPG